MSTRQLGANDLRNRTERRLCRVQPKPEILVLVGGEYVAWRVTDRPEELAVRGLIEAAGLSPTPQIDRFWFKSVYFREPGGTLFELATDGPGFDRDEDPGRLGEQLVLAPWLEAHRKEIEAALTSLVMPRVGPQSRG